jgi:serine/threonine-protein kinase
LRGDAPQCTQKFLSQAQDEDAGLPKPGDLIAGKFRIERMIGRGGMGAVFSAQHEMLGQRVAIKMLLASVASNREVVARFLNEARLAARIEGEHVARVTDVGTLDDGRPYMIIEYLEGSDLGQVLEAGGPLPVREAVDYVLQALEALAQAHAQGMVHRDFKPSNLFLARRSDGTTLVKVLDFGIAKAAQPLALEANQSLTKSNSMLGSPQYMAPEQLRNAKNVDAQTDIWAVGLTLYELLSGAPPFAGATFGELFVAIIEQSPRPLGEVRADVDSDLEAIVARCLQREPKERFATVAELAQALSRHGSSRAAYSVERIHSVLPPAIVAGSSSSMPPGRESFVVKVAGHEPVEVGALTSIAPPPPAEATAPPFSSSQSFAPSRNHRSTVVAGAVLAAALGAAGLLWVGRSTPVDTAPKPTPAVVAPAVAAPGSAAAEPAPPTVEWHAPGAALAAIASPLDAGPTRARMAAPGASASSARASAPAAPPAPPPAAPTSKTRVDQTGLAGENPFR